MFRYTTQTMACALIPKNPNGLDSPDEAL